jgi:hypothetical protein
LETAREREGVREEIWVNNLETKTERANDTAKEKVLLRDLEKENTKRENKNNRECGNHIVSSKWYSLRIFQNWRNIAHIISLAKQDTEQHIYTLWQQFIKKGRLTNGLSCKRHIIKIPLRLWSQNAEILISAWPVIVFMTLSTQILYYESRKYNTHLIILLWELKEIIHVKSLVKANAKLLDKIFHLAWRQGNSIHK